MYPVLWFPPGISRWLRYVSSKGVDDRELLRCDNCGLQEDVIVTGQLITYISGAAVSDSGLRFEKAVGDTHACPVCGAPALEG